jgi:hypothetical protein
MKTNLELKEIKYIEYAVVEAVARATSWKEYLSILEMKLILRSHKKHPFKVEVVKNDNGKTTVWWLYPNGDRIRS